MITGSMSRECVEPGIAQVVGRIKGMNFEVCRKRRAAAAAKSAGVDGLLVTHLPDVRYLCGFTGSNAALVLAGGQAVLFTDGRYTAQAKGRGCGNEGGDREEAGGDGGVRVDGGGGGAAVRVRCGAYDGGGAGGDAEGCLRARCGGGCLCRWGRWLPGCAR